MANLRVYTDTDLLKRTAAEHVVSVCERAVNAHGYFSIALSGGSTPRVLYELLADPSFSRYIDWDRVHVFWGDERCVPPDHSDSNFRMARMALLDHVPLPLTNIHRLHGEIDPTEAAADYERTLRQFFAHRRDGAVRLDLVLLGMGDDGHTASLFPGTAALDINDQIVAANYVDKLQSWRLTLTYLTINAADYVTFLIAGRSKAEPLREVLEGDYRPAELPAQGVNPASGNLLWLVDDAAAALLSRRGEGL